MVMQGREWIIATLADPCIQMKVVLATSALLYHISWPYINDNYPPGMPQSVVYSLLTKFIFVFIGLSCFVSLFPALKSKRLDSVRPANQFVYYTAVLICLLITTINYVGVWRWALVAIDEYFTRGYLFDDPSLFDKTAVVLCSSVLSGTLLALVAAQWMRIVSRWRDARRALWVEAEEKDRRLGQTSSPIGMEKPEL